MPDPVERELARITLQEIEQELLRIASDVTSSSWVEEELRDLASRVAVARLAQGAAV